MDDKDKTHRVGVLVFMNASGVDFADATNVACALIRDKLADGILNPLPVTLEFERRDGVKFTGEVIQVMEVGMAAGNGYLWTNVTSKSWRERGG